MLWSAEYCHKHLHETHFLVPKSKNAKNLSNMSQEPIVSASQRGKSWLLSEEDEVVDSCSGNGRSDGGVMKPVRKEAERAYLVANDLCWHCVTPVGIDRLIVTYAQVSHNASTDCWPPIKPVLLHCRKAS